MKAKKRTEALFSRAQELGLIGLSGDGTPTFGMVYSAIGQAERDAAEEASELAMYVRRLARIVRKHDPENAVVKSAVEFLKCTGHINPLR